MPRAKRFSRIQDIPRSAATHDARPALTHRLRSTLDLRAVFSAILPFVGESAPSAWGNLIRKSSDQQIALINAKRTRTAPEVDLGVDAIDGGAWACR